jgi:hypothetical protein
MERDAVLASQESLFNMWNLSMPGRHGLFSSESEKMYHLKVQIAPRVKEEPKKILRPLSLNYTKMPSAEMYE